MKGLSYHVNVENLDPKTEIILVKYAFKLVIQHDCTVFEPSSSPTIQRAALKLALSVLAPIITLEQDLPRLSYMVSRDSRLHA